MAQDPGEVDRNVSVLTKSDREFLLSSEQEREDNWSRAGRSKRWESITERLGNALADLELLAKECPPERRAPAFDAELGTDDEQRLTRQLAAVVELLYTDVHSEAHFRGVLETGVRNGAANRGIAESPLHVDVDYRGVSVLRPESAAVTSARIANDEWENITPADLEAWVRQMKHGSTSFDIDSFLEERDELVDEIKRLREAADDSDSDTDAGADE